MLRSQWEQVAARWQFVLALERRAVAVRRPAPRGYLRAGPRAAGPLLSAQRAAFPRDGAQMSPFNHNPNLWSLFPTCLMYRQRFGLGCARRELRGRGAEGDTTSVPRPCPLHLHRLWDQAEDTASPEPASDKGFDNPMFDVVSGPCLGIWGTWGRGGAQGSALGVFCWGCCFPSPSFAFPSPAAAGTAGIWLGGGGAAGAGSPGPADVLPQPPVRPQRDRDLTARP